MSTGDQCVFVRHDRFSEARGYPAIELMEDIALSKILRRRSRPLCLTPPVTISGRRWRAARSMAHHGADVVAAPALFSWAPRPLGYLSCTKVSTADENHEGLRTQGSAAAQPMLVQIFAKAPVPGAVKTRLIASLGERGAAELHCRLLRHAARTVALARVGEVELWTTAGADPALLHDITGLSGNPFRMQPDGDLGARMSVAIADGLARAPGVVLLGVDVPGMCAEDLRQAREVLAHGYDAVLGPAEDGGYWLIGLSRRARGLGNGVEGEAARTGALFRAVAWGTPGVLQATRERLRSLGWRWHELPVRWDVDRPEDLRRLAADPQLAALVADLMPRA